ncbi:MAG TPA: ABC transporter permease [Candidatus Limnocylindrales bacterium]|nr:ABC transporter permease [Candidatus Limnocylindrales bacterium]
MERVETAETRPAIGTRPGGRARALGARLVEAARGFGYGIGAIGVKELRGRMRGRRAFVVLSVHLLLVAGFAWMVQLLTERETALTFGAPAFFASAEVGRRLFVALLGLQTLIVLVLAPASTSGAISLEREKQTLDLLAATPISSLAIVLGKLLSALAWLFLLIVASIPITALVFTFGGVSPDDLVRGYVVLVVTAIAFGSLGLFMSALVKRTQAATVLNLVAVLAATAGATFVFAFWSLMLVGSGAPPDRPVREGDPVGVLVRRPPEALLYLNPFVAQADVICGTEVGFGAACSIISGVTGASFAGIGEPQPFGFARDTYWPKSAAASLGLSVVLILLSTQLVSPTRRWRPRLPRLLRPPGGAVR